MRSRGVPTPPVHESDTATKVLTPRTLERELKDRDNGNPCCAYPANLFIAKMLFFCTSMSNVGEQHYDQVVQLIHIVSQISYSFFYPSLFQFLVCIGSIALHDLSSH